VLNDLVWGVCWVSVLNISNISRTKERWQHDFRIGVRPIAERHVVLRGGGGKLCICALCAQCSYCCSMTKPVLYGKRKECGVMNCVLVSGEINPVLVKMSYGFHERLTFLRFFVIVVTLHAKLLLRVKIIVELRT
jgi:hypothetical protein